MHHYAEGGKFRLRGRLIARHAKGWIAEEHKFHSLKENAWRIPVFVGLQGSEVFMLEIKADGAGPAIAESWLLRVSQCADETIRKRQRARLAASVATDIGDGTVGATL